MVAHQANGPDAGGDEECHVMIVVMIEKIHPPEVMRLFQYIVARVPWARGGDRVVSG